MLAAGLRTRFKDGVNQAFVANYAITATNNFSPIGLASEKAVRTVPGVTGVVGVRAGDGKAFGSHINVTGVPPNVSQAIKVDWQAGGRARRRRSSGATARSSTRTTPRPSTSRSARRCRWRLRPARSCT